MYTLKIYYENGLIQSSCKVCDTLDDAKKTLMQLIHNGSKNYRSYKITNRKGKIIVSSDLMEL